MSQRISNAEEERLRRLLARLRSTNAAADRTGKLPEVKVKALLQDLEYALLPLIGTEASIANRRTANS
jgi:hypothetical protein